MLKKKEIKANGSCRVRHLCHVLQLLFLLLPVSVCWAEQNLLSDTGQRKCYDMGGNEICCPTRGNPLYGQDAQYQGVSPALQDNGDQTVTDQNTGLTWLKSEADVQHTWENAISYCNELDFAGESDWRLPGKIELESIVNYSSSYPAADQVFSCESSFYWSATSHKPNPPYAWGVFCADGADHWLHKSNQYYIRCVRSGNKTVLESDTGLEWQQNDKDQLHTWESALAYCETLSLDAKDDWRLPNIRELKSLVDYDRYYPAIDPAIPCRSSIYWSSTTVVSDTQPGAWATFFGNGDDIWKAKADSHHVRCVRSTKQEQ